jgi:AAA ATPase domain
LNPRDNPFAPGAGTRPPALVGRDQILENAHIAIDRAVAGRLAKGQLLLGLRGVGKTVLLNRFEELAERAGAQTLFIEVLEGQDLPAQLVPRLRRLLIKLDRKEKAKDGVRRATAVLRSFASVFKVSVGELDFSVESEPGAADSGRLDLDLTDLLVAVSAAAVEAQTAVVLLIDEVQYLSSTDLGALIVAIHKLNQRAMPFLLLGAGLPQLAALAGESKSYAERLFEYPEIGPLGPEAASRALSRPVEELGVSFDDAAVRLIVARTRGYPYFLQEWGKQSWDIAAPATITAGDASRAGDAAIRQLDAGFFRVRLDRLTPREKRYVRAMAQLGEGAHRSGEVSAVYGAKVQAVGPLRAALIRKGMIYSPAHGDTAFTVPLFVEFLKRSMPWPPESTG